MWNPEVQPKVEKLGMTIRSLTADERKEADLDNGVGLGCDAIRRGIRAWIGVENDVIVEADRQSVNSPMI